MTKRFVHAFIVIVAVLWQASSLAGQMPSQQKAYQTRILPEAAKKIENVAPDWRFLPAVCGLRGPLLNEEVSVECGTWQPVGRGTASAEVMVILRVIATTDAASRRIDSVKERRLADGWTTVAYELGDGAFLAVYLGGRRYSIEVRKGRLLAQVSAESKSDAQRIAEYVVTAISGEK